MERNHEMEGREGGSKRNRDGRSLSFDERLDPAQQSFPRSEGSPVFALSFLFKYFSFFFLSWCYLIKLVFSFLSIGVQYVETF